MTQTTKQSREIIRGEAGQPTPASLLLRRSVTVFELKAATVGTVTDILQRAFPHTHVNVRVDNSGGATASTVWSWSGESVDHPHSQECSTHLFVEIHLPTFKTTSSIDGRTARRVVALIVHELCHNLFTDWQAWSVAVNKGSQFKNMVNAIEDCRIEREMQNHDYVRNARELLEDLTAFFAARRTKAMAELDEPRAGVLGLCVELGRVELCGYRLPDAERELFSMASQATINCWLNQIKPELHGLKSTQDVVDLVQSVFDSFEETGEDGDSDGEGEGEGEPSEDSEGESGEGDGEGQSDEDADFEPGQKKTNKPSDTPSHETNGLEDTDNGEGEDGETGHGNAAGSPDGDKPDLEPQEGEQLDASSFEIEEQDQDKLSNDAREDYLINECGPDQWKIAPKPARYQFKSMASVDVPHSAKLERDLAQLLAAPQRSRTLIHQEQGRKVAPRDMTRVLVGAQNVFSRKVITPRKNTAVIVLLDQSSSMYGDIYDASRAVCLLARAIERNGAKSMVLGFRDGSYNQWSVAKMFNQSLHQGCFTILNQCNGSTPMSPAIISAAQLMPKVAPRECTDHLIMVITDGQCNHGEFGLRRAVEFSRMHGIDVCAVGLGGGAAYVPKVFDNGAYAPNVDALASEGLMTLIKQAQARSAA